MLQVTPHIIAPARRRTYPFAVMAVGDTFFVPEDCIGEARAIRDSLVYCARRRLPKRFVVRIDSDGVRCERTA